MIIKMIPGHTRICGKAQGFLGLPLRDVVVDDKVLGKVPAMESAWEPTPKELAAINHGGLIVVRILGETPPPMLVGVETFPFAEKVEK